MNNQNIFKQFFRAVFHELFRSKTLYNLMASLVLLSVVALGYFWKESYVSQTSITIGQRTSVGVIQDESSNRNLADRLSSIFFSRSFQESLAVKFQLQEPVKDVDIFLRDLQKHATLSLENSTLARLSYSSESPSESQERLIVILRVLLDRVQPKSKDLELQNQGEEIQNDKLKTNQKIRELDELISDLRLSNFDEDTSSSKQRIASIRESIQDVEVNINASHAKIDGMRRKLEKEALIQDAQKRLGALIAQRDKLSVSIEELKKQDSFSAANVVSIEQEIDNLSVEINTFSQAESDNLQKSREESVSLYTNLRNRLTLEEVELASLLSREESLRNLLQDVRAKAASEESYSIEIEQHQRALDELIKQIRLLESREEKNRLAQKAEREVTPNYLVLDQPSLPQKYSGLGFIEFLIIGPVFAFCLPFFIASLIVLLDSRIRTTRQLRNYKARSVPILSVIPHYNSPKTLRVFRKAVLGLLVWCAFVFSVYFALGVIGLKH